MTSEEKVYKTKSDLINILHVFLADQDSGERFREANTTEELRTEFQ
jgi:hypothetical protein